MLKTATLFSILAVLAHAQEAARGWKQGYAPEDNTPCYVNGQQGSVKGALCVIGGLGLGKRLLGGLGGLGEYNRPSHGYNFREGDRCDVGGRYGVVENTLCVIAELDLNVKRHWEHDHYGFGWFHPGPFDQGDRCWSGAKEGIIRDSACIDVDVALNSYLRDGYFERPYYGYGHRFGWFHPGPFMEGDRCTQDGRLGQIREALCIAADLDLGLGKRHFFSGPDYWHEPYFYPGQDFGWFHEGPFQQGDRCWQEGRYGDIVDSLCVLADLNINLKREPLLNLLGGGQPAYRHGDRCFKDNRWGLWGQDGCDTTLDLDVILAGRALFADGDKCWHQGHWGSWKANGCDINVDLDLDVIVEKRGAGQLFRDDPWLGRGVPCTRDGIQGILRDSICIVADIGLILKRESIREEAEVEAATPDAEFTDIPEGSTSGWDFAGDVAQYLEQYSEDYEHDEEFAKRLLSFVPGDNNGHDAAKTVSDLLDGVKTRGLISGSKESSVYGNGAPPKGLLGETGIDKLLGERFVGGNGFRIDELVDTLGLGKREAVARQIGGLGDMGSLGGLGGLGKGGNGDMVGGLLGGLGGGRNSDIGGVLSGGGRKGAGGNVLGDNDLLGGLLGGL